MKGRRYRIAVTGLAIAAFVPLALSLMRSGAQAKSSLLGHSASQAATPLKVAEDYGKLPISFEANQGQADPRVQFQAHGSSYSLLLTRDSAILAVSGSSPKDGDNTAEANPELQESRRLKLPANARDPLSIARLSRTDGKEQRKDPVFFMRVSGANPNVRVEGLDELSAKSNYFIGCDPRQWHTHIPNYATVKYTNVYPGVDLVYYGNQGRLEYDFVVKPGADPRQIMLAIQSPPAKSSSMSELRIDRRGDLVVGAEGSAVKFRKPVVYQATFVNGALTADERRRITDRHFVDGKYILKGNRVMFEVAAYDRSKPLVIDPTLVYSTYLGGKAAAQGYAIAVDASGNVYVTGRTASGQFPTTAGAFSTKASPGYADVFVAELNAAGSALVYATYLGGTYDDEGDGIAVDASGDAYVTGWTASANFPTTAGAFQTIFGGGFDDGFVAKLNATGSALLYSTYLGGRSHDEGHAVALDTSGDAYVTGLSYSSNFPTTAGSLRTTLSGLDDAFVSKLDPSGSSLVYSTYLGGMWHDDGHGIVVDASGDVYIAGFSDSVNFPTTAGAFQTKPGGGYDAFVSKLNSTASALIYSTYVGGANNDFGYGIAVDASGNVHLTGESYSANFPTTPGAFQTTLSGSGTGHDDAFVSKLNAAGSALLYSTYLGGSANNVGYGIAVDGSGHALVTGATTSFDFPTTASAFQTTPGGYDDAFFSKLNAAGSGLVYSTHLAGKALDEGRGITVDSLGNAYIAGRTESTNFPVTTGAFETILQSPGDAFVAKISAQ